MKRTFHDHLSVIEQVLSPVLLSAAGRESLGRLCSLFPYDTAAEFGFENRLGTADASCDFFLQIRKDAAGAAIIAGNSRISSLTGALRDDPFWKRIAALFEAWTDSTHVLADQVDVFWLEFDHGEATYSIIPNIFFKIREQDGLDRAGQWRHMRNVLDAVYAILFDIPFPDGLAVTLQSCIEALPDKAALYQIGFMVPRKFEAIRLVLTNFNRTGIFDYLHRVHWPGEFDALEAMHEAYVPKFDYVVYNLNIGKGVLPFLGMEMYFRGMRQPPSDPRWRDVLDFLVARNVLLQPKREALTGYCGRIIASHLYAVRYINGVNHIKLSYRPGAPVECKGYFGTMIRDCMDQA